MEKIVSALKTEAAELARAAGKTLEAKRAADEVAAAEADLAKAKSRLEKKTVRAASAACPRPTRDMRLRQNIYWLASTDDPTFLKGITAAIHVGNGKGGSVVAGVMGIVHPEVLARFTIPFPCSAVELNVEVFL